MSAQEGVSLKKCSRGGLRKRGIAAREALKEEERAEKSAQICRRMGLVLSVEQLSMNRIS